MGEGERDAKLRKGRQQRALRLPRTRGSKDLSASHQRGISGFPGTLRSDPVAGSVAFLKAIPVIA